MAFLALIPAAMAAAGAAAGTAATVAAVASTAVAAAGAISAADAQRRAAHTSADIATQNQQIALAQGAQREEASRRDSAQQLGRQAAAFAESGVDPTSGSALQIAKQSATNAEFDAQNIAYESQMQGFSFQRQALVDRNTASNATQNGYYGVASAVAGGVSRMYQPSHAPQPVLGG